MSEVDVLELAQQLQKELGKKILESKNMSNACRLMSGVIGSIKADQNTLSS